MTDAEAAPPSEEIVRRWWRDLQDLRADGTPNPRVDRRARATLRRADAATAAAEEAVHRLYRRLNPGRGYSDQRMAQTLRVARVLVHVRADDARSAFGRALGPSKFDADDASLSPLRFQRLLSAREEEDVVREFRRAVDLAGGTANVRDLARLLLRWSDSETGDQIRARFAFDYFGAEAPAAI